MVTPRLLKPLKVEILKFPFGEEAQDNIWRTTERTTEEILDDPSTPRAIVKAQITFKSFDELAPVVSGSNETTDGYLIITEATQDRHGFKANDHVIRLLPIGKKCRSVRLRIIEVRPAAQRSSFGLYRIEFKDDSRGR